MSYKVGIICAGDMEFAPFKNHIHDFQITEKAMLKIYEGTVNGLPVAALFSGVCKVNAAIATQILIDYCHADMVINCGTAGGIDPKLELFDTVIATESVYHDVAPHILTEFHPWMDTEIFPSDQKLIFLSQTAVKKLNSKQPIYWGRMATGEAFITDDGRQEIIQHYAPLTADMETASIAHVCYVNKIPFLSIRSITDTAKHSGVGHFEINCPKAAAIAKDITLAILAEIKESL